MASTLFRFFPMPRFLAMEGGGIEISDRSVKYMRFNHERNGPTRIVSSGEISLPPGAVMEGLIREREGLLTTLKQVRGICRFSLCAASLPESKGYLFSDQLPRAAGEDITGALALTLSSHVPLAPAEAVYDAEILESESSLEQLSLIAAAVSEDTALGYASVLTDAGFLPISFELEPQAAARAVVRPTSGPQAVIIADLGQTKTMLCVVERGVPRFTTSSEGSEELDASITHAGIDEREVVRRKIDMGVVHGTPEESRTFVPLADRFAAEISRLATYWNAHGAGMGGQVAVGQAILYGGNANIKGLPEYISRQVGFPVTVADVWGTLGITTGVPSIALDQSMRFATVAGLALRAMHDDSFE